MLPLAVPVEGDTFAEAVVDVVDAEVVAGIALLATTAGVEVVEDLELVEPEELVIDISDDVDVAVAAQAQTALPEASTAIPVTAPQALRTPDRAALLIASVECYN